MSFRVGQKVMFIGKGRFDGAIHIRNGKYGWIPLEHNTPYTIREIYEDPVTRVAGIRLVEVINDKYGGLEVGYMSEEFRPIIDISIFTNMLKEKPKPREKVISMAERDKTMQRGKWTV